MSEPDPDQLLRALDAQLAQARARRPVSDGTRNTVRVMGIVIMLAGTVALLIAMEYVASQMEGHRPVPKAQPAEQSPPK